jgi:hypothetical protein
VLLPELVFEVLGNRLRVSFLDEQRECSLRFFLVALRAALRPPHPGTITYLEEDRVVSVQPIEEVPEGARYAETSDGLVPVVKVVAAPMGPDAREIVELGPSGQRLRSTVQVRSPR